MNNTESKEPLYFELGTPVRFLDNNGNEVSGEVVTRDGVKCVSLYKDSNYSGMYERIRVPNWNEVKSFYTN